MVLRAGLLGRGGRGMRRSWVVASSMTGGCACGAAAGASAAARFFFPRSRRYSIRIGTTETKTIRTRIASTLFLMSEIWPSQ